MHELAITQSVVDAVVERVDGAKVRVLTLEIGTLSGVVPDSVRFCFDLVTAGTALAGATLVILEPPGIGDCRTCGDSFTMEDAFPLCPCGSADVKITDGQQLKITSVEVH